MVVPRFTLVASADGLDRLTEKTAKPAPSATVTELTDSVGVSLLVPPVPVPSSAMVVVTEPVAMVALAGALRLTE